MLQHALGTSKEARSAITARRRANSDTYGWLHEANPPHTTKHSGDSEYLLANLAKAIINFEYGIHYDPTRSIIHYHLSDAYLRVAETVMQRNGFPENNALIDVFTNLEAAVSELNIARKTDSYGRLGELIKRRNLRYKRLKQKLMAL